MQDNFTIVTNPIARMKLMQLREHAMRAKTSGEDIDGAKNLMREIGMLLTYEVARDLATRQISFDTPRGEAVGTILREDRPVVVHILRSGLVMAEAFQAMLSDTHTGHIGIHRDKDHPERKLLQYVVVLPDPNPPDRLFIVLDPVIATGETADQALNILKEHGATNISFVSMIVSRPARDRLTRDHPDVRFYAIAVDEELDHAGNVRPGLGSVSELLFGYKTTTSHPSP